MPIDLREFRHLLAALGPDLATWPKDAADDAVDLMAASTEAQDLFVRVVAETPRDDDGEDPSALVERIITGQRSLHSERD